MCTLDKQVVCPELLANCTLERLTITVFHDYVVEMMGFRLLWRKWFRYGISSFRMSLLVNSLSLIWHVWGNGVDIIFCRR